MLLFLIGYRGSGKSAVAPLLAARLGWDWCDSDEQVEQLAGKSIAEIFADSGEETFRKLERQVVAELCERDRTVVALGGGAVLLAETRQVIAQRGKVVWLTADPETLWQRISQDQSTAARRPNLTAAGGIVEITATLGAREPLYRECAGLQIDSEHKSPDQVAEEILNVLDVN